MFETLSKQELNAMTSDQYKQHFDGANGDEFRKRVSELESQSASTGRKRGSVRGEEPPANPASTQGGFDPSFDDAPTAAPDFPAAAPVAAQPAAAQPAAVTDFSQLPELEHSYQPMVDGKRAGGLQKFKYRTVNDPNDPNSLVMQLQRAHSYASARIRTLSRDRKLDSIVAAGAAPRIQPEKEVPTTVEGLAAELRAQRESNFALSVRAAVNEFQASVDWSRYRSNENAQSVILAVERAGDDPTDPQAYHRAFVNMQQFLEPVVTATAAATVEPIPAPVVEQPKAAAVPATRPSNAARLATGLSNADVFNPEVEAAPEKVAGVRLTMPDGKKQVMTLQEWNRQSSEFQKRVLRSSANAAQIEALYDAEDQRKAAARR